MADGNAHTGGGSWSRYLRRGARILAEVLVGVLVAVLALALVAVLLLHTGRGRELVRTQLVERISAALAGQARIAIGRVDGLLVDRIVLRDVRLTDAYGRTAVTARAVVLDYDLLSLLRRTFHVDEVLLRETYVHAYYGPEGKLNLATLTEAEPDARPSAWTVDIDRLMARSGRVRFRSQGGTVYRVDEIVLAGSLRWQAAVLRMRVDRAKGYWVDRNLPVAVAGSLRQEGAMMTLDDVSLQMGQSEVHVPWLRLRMAADDRDLGDRSALATMTACGYVAAAVMPADARRLGMGVDLRTRVSGRGWVCRHDPDAPWQVGLVASAGPGKGFGNVLGSAPGTVAAQAEVRPGNGKAPLQGTLWLQARALDPAAIVTGAPVANLDARVLATWAGTRIDTVRGTATAEIHGSIDSLGLDGERDDGWANVHANADARVEVVGDTVFLRSARLDAHLDDLGQAIPGLSTGSARLEVTASGPVDRLDVRGVLTGHALRVGQVRARRVRVRVDVADAPAAPTGLVDVDARGVRYGDQRIGPVQATLRLRELGRRLALRFAVGSADAPYSASGRLTAVRRPDARPDEGMARVRARVRALVVRTRNIVWRGRGATIVLAGPVTGPHRIAVEGLALRSEAADVYLEADLRRGRGARASGGASGVPWAGRAHLRVASGDIDMLAGLLAPDAPFMHGHGHLEATVTLPRGGRGAAARASGRADLRLTGLRTRALPAPVDAHVRVDLDGQALAMAADVDGRALGAVLVRATGTVPARPLSANAWRAAGVRVLDTARLVGRDLDLHRLRRFLPGGQAIAGALEGTMDTTVVAQQQDDVVDLTARFQGIRLAALTEDISGQLEVELAPARTTATLRAALPGGATMLADAILQAGSRQLRARGVGALARAPIQGTARIPDLALSTVEQALDIHQELVGRVDVSATIAGTPRAPVVEARLQTPQARVGDLVFSELVAAGRYDRGVWSGNVRARQADGGTFAATIESMARGSTAPGTPLRVQIDASRFRLGFLTPILRRADAAVVFADGLMSAEATLSGTMARPSIRGWLRVWEGELRLARGLVGPISAAEGYLVADAGTVRLRFRGTSGRGSFRLEGEAALAGLTPTSFESVLTSEAMTVRAGATPVALDGRIEAQGRRQGSLWRMDVSVEDGLVRLPTRLSDTELHETGALPDVVYVDAAARAAEPRQGLATTVRMQLRTPGGVRVRGQDVEALAEANLDITFIRDQVSATGTIQLERGRMSLFDRRYDIARGRIVFEGRMPPEPRLDIRLANKTDGTTVYIDVTGTVDEPRIELTADPPDYDRAQLLSYVLGGNLTGGDTDVSLRAHALEAIGGLLSRQVEELVKRTFPVDILRVGLEEGANAVAFVTVGKWISKDVFVAYRRRFTEVTEGENINEAQLEYQVSERWVIEARVGDAGFSSVDVLWTRRF